MKGESRTFSEAFRFFGRSQGGGGKEGVSKMSPENLKRRSVLRRTAHLSERLRAALQVVFVEGAEWHVEGRCIRCVESERESNFHV